MKQCFCLVLIIVVVWSCNQRKEGDSQKTIAASALSGDSLASIHCGRCHAFVKPEFLSKSSWKNDVLPSMGHRMGIYKGDHQPDSLFDPGIGGLIVRNANIYPEQAILAEADWKKITDYYLSNAPDTILPPCRIKKIQIGLRHFKYREALDAHRPALTSMVKILPANRGIVYSDGKRDNSVLTFLTADLRKSYDIFFKTTPVHYHERLDTLYVTTAGQGVFPNDVPAGALHKVARKGADERYKDKAIIIPNLQRPVYMLYSDLNKDGREDIVACEFGDLTGKLVWFENKGQDRYTEHLLRDKPGAIKAVVKDINKDGSDDIFVLMAQGDEGVFMFENNGDGTFTEKRLLTFLPLFGSQYIELADFNKDGYDDLIYVCGDNADRTPFLKAYHGIYIFLNDGKSNFKQSYFYQLNGAYKAIPADYDLDGDLDIAAISFFPDYANSPEESFVYLENKGNFKFSDYSFTQAANGRWIVMDAADMDSDGDVDLALGSFVFFKPQGDTTGLGKRWMSSGPSVIVLENTTH